MNERASAVRLGLFLLALGLRSLGYGCWHWLTAGRANPTAGHSAYVQALTLGARLAAGQE
jgi:hypothetical protein